MKGEGNARAGCEVRPVDMLNAERGAVLVREWTMVRCDRQDVGVIAEVLLNGSVKLSRDIL
jgi:hypothetical protein